MKSLKRQKLKEARVHNIGIVNSGAARKYNQQQ